MLKDYIQIPWQEIDQIGANVSGRKISRHFESIPENQNFSLLQKTLEKF